MPPLLLFFFTISVFSWSLALFFSPFRSGGGSDVGGTIPGGGPATGVARLCGARLLEPGGGAAIPGGGALNPATGAPEGGGPGGGGPAGGGGPGGGGPGGGGPGGGCMME
jgi:hypothetical protein